MTSHEWNAEKTRLTLNGTMREFRRPALCVIDENGVEVTHGSSDLDNGNVPSVQCNGSLGNYSHEICDHNANNVTKTENGNYLSPLVEKDLDLCELKATTARLKLSTRRNSTVAWQQQFLDSSQSPVLPKFDPTKLKHNADDAFTEERKNRINEALAWIRSELLQMRSEDEKLARKLLSIRHDIHQLKLQRSCAEHQEMLDDVTESIEENYVINEFSDIPVPDSMHDTPLRHLGVTRMHLNSRRFSIL